MEVVQEGLKVAKYCIMDCELCIHLLLQLDIIPNNIGMATVHMFIILYLLGDKV